MPEQIDWRYCNKCHGMFYDGYPDKGRCAAGGGHEAIGYNFLLPYDIPGTANAQTGWRYCHKCHTIFYNDHPEKGLCAAGGGHESAGYGFVLPHDIPGTAVAQPDWRYCHKCHTMFYDGYPEKGLCAAGGGHESAGYNFVLPHLPPQGITNPAIRDKWVSLGGEHSWLGYPTSDEQDFSENGRVVTFQRGAIYWWPDTGAIEMGNICVRYKGLACFSTTFGAGSDEPYAILGVVPAPPTAGSSVRTVIYKDVEGGKSCEDDIELYRGLPYGLSLSITLMEHDTGDPDKYRKTVEEGVKQASIAAAALVDKIPYVGPYLAPVTKVFLENIGPDMAEEVNSLLGTDDDYVGSTSLFVSGKDMVTMARAEPKNFRGIVWHMESPLISGDGADYKVYIGIWAV